MEPKRVEKEADFVGLQPRVEAAVVSNAQSCETGSGKLAGAERGETQGPLKAEISAYADEIIRDEWKNGDAVTGKTAPQFAADVLLYVRKRFYAATSPKVNSGKALGKAPAGKPPGGLRAQKLTLEHMRWIFDAKIEPRVACLRKDLFLCSKCQGTKLYGFKSVVQHYAAKHTTTLSAGNVVVNWRAAWPQLSIFDPRPGDHASSWSKPKAPKSTNTKPKSAPRVSLTSAPADPRSVSTHHFREAGTYSQPSNQTASISHSASFGPPATPIKSSCSSPHPHEQEGLYSHPPVLSGPLATQEDLVSRVARDVWDKMGSLVSLQRGYEDIKLCVVIHHVSKSLEQQCDEARQLKVFMMGLRRQDLLIPLRSVGGLSCKTCRESNPAARHRKMGILKLSQHFINKHHGGQAKQPTGKQLDWRVDMIWLPKYPAMKQLPALIRHDKVLSGLIHAALPWIFGNEARAQEPCSLDVAPISRQVAHEGQRHPSSAPANEVSEPSYIGCSTAPSLNAEGFETSARPASLPSKVRIPELHHGNSGHDIPPNSGVIDPSGNQRNTFVGRQYPLGPGDIHGTIRPIPAIKPNHSRPQRVLKRGKFPTLAVITSYEDLLAASLSMATTTPAVEKPTDIMNSSPRTTTRPVTSFHPPQGPPLAWPLTTRNTILEPQPLIPGGAEFLTAKPLGEGKESSRKQGFLVDTSILRSRIFPFFFPIHVE
ncbi:hypothetical protein UVI_02037320 [Ustilaginoidea virens]|uniref:DUF7892 domain-containing protein n=1 Tax=Ustilaginoidea virens TaxID=1159556 RepID=A0A1B5L496_USTVR|nr:hypothetical protein UVI_02037320 [Ustilaginoidea virens]